MDTYKYVLAVQDNGPNYWLIYRGRITWKQAPIARCESEEEAKFITGQLNGEGHKRTEQNEVDYIGCRIAQRLTYALNDKIPVPYKELETWIYGELEQVEKEHRIGDWIELPNGTTYTLTYKPYKEK